MTSFDPDNFNRRPARPARVYHSGRRTRNHVAAHADSSSALPYVVPNDPLIPAQAPELITTAPGLAELIAHIRQVGSFGYDSEFIGELSYYPKLCLIQVATRHRIALIDPLVGLDLTPFWSLLCDPCVEKIVHAGQQDLEPVVRHLDESPARIFDTQIASGFLGLSYPVALVKLIQEFVGLELPKGLKFSQWDQRPLSSVQLRYAADDVRYLPILRQLIGQRMEESGNAAWAWSELEALGDKSIYRPDPRRQSLRLRGTLGLRPRQMAILQSLLAWRDDTARELDMPPRTFLKDALLLTLARRPVKKREKLETIRGLPHPVKDNYGHAIVALTLQALDLPAAKLPAVLPPLGLPEEQTAADELWRQVLALCEMKKVDPVLVATRREIAQAYQHLCSGQSAWRMPALRGWRQELLGDLFRTVLDVNTTP